VVIVATLENKLPMLLISVRNQRAATIARQGHRHQPFRRSNDAAVLMAVESVENGS